MILTASIWALVPLFSIGLADDFFPGQQNGVGSWFRADNAQDSTNGHSWCGYQYSDSDPLFAVSLRAMGGVVYDAADPSPWKKATADYCGREAKVTDPSTGNTMLLYIGDAFDDTWVKSPGSIDIMIDAFSQLHGNPNGDKNDVIANPNVQWELTGKINPRYNPSGRSSTGSASPTTLMTASQPSASCDWGCAGWDCSASVPCQSPNSCVRGYCRAQ